MQAVLEKIFDDNTKSCEAKKSLLQTILNNIKNNESKIAFLKSGISYLLSMEDKFDTLFLRQYLLDYIQEMQSDCYSLDEIKTIFEAHDDLFTLVSFTDLVLKVSKDRTKTLQIRSVFLKAIKKDENFWYINFIKEFLIQKLKKPAASSAQSNPIPVTVTSLPDFEYNKHFLQVKTAFAFFVENPSFYPPNFDSKDVLLKWFLTIKGKTETEKAFQVTIIEEILQICRTNYQFYMTCFKMFIKALTIAYSNDEIFECHYSIYNFLKQTDPKAIEELMKPLMVGDPLYNTQDWLKVFKNFLRVGLTENIGIAFLSLARGFENIKAFEVLLRVQEEVVPFTIVPLKVEAWQQSALDILAYFILQGPINANLLSKILKKLFTVANEVCKAANYTQFASDLVSFLGHLKIKYSQSSFVEEIETEYNNFLRECQINQIQINLQRYSISPWTSLQVQTNQTAKSKYRGLVNLGNTCYMNSFVQALFMTKLFRYRILSLGDIVQKLYSVSESLKEPAESTTNNNKTHLEEKKKAVGLFQLQKLFAYLVSSEREAITPTFLKATLPLHFKTSHAQEDSSEFGRFYLDDLEKSLAQTEERELIKEMFTGEVISNITCQDCQTKYKKTENFMDLSLNFESRDPSVSYDLHNLVDKNFEPIEFKDDNKYYCEKCEKLSSCAVKTQIPSRLPPVLILTINRFYFDTKTFQRVKVLSHVNVTEELELTQQNELGIQEEIKYDLFAIIVHRGMTLDYGHYYTAAKENVNDPTWILFDDSTTMSLEKLDPFEYVKNNKQDAPYILFYQARDYFNKSMNSFNEFKLTTGLRRIVEQDNVSYLKEIDQNAKLMASITALNVPQTFMTGPSLFKKDDEDDDDVSKPNGFNNSNRFIM